MPDTTISPNMNMPVPNVGEAPGPDWATDLNACLSIIDSHNHTAGQGVAITPSAININADLPLNGNNLTEARSLRMNAQSATISDPSDLNCLYDVNGDLYFNDGSANQIRLTQSGSPAGATGTITGLPSGTASASFAGSTFTFQSATNTPAALNVGPVIIGQPVASGFNVTVSPSVSQASNYALTLPLALPTVPSFIQSSTSGNLSFSSVVAEGILISTNASAVMTPTDGIGTYLFSTGGTNYTLGLAAAASSAGRIVKAMKIDSGVGQVRMDPGASTVNGAATYAMYGQYESVTLVCDGTNWLIIDSTPSAWQAFTPAISWLVGAAAQTSYWRKCQNILQLRARINITGGVTATALQSTLPAGFNFDTSVLPSPISSEGSGAFGEITFYDDSADRTYGGLCVYFNADTLRFKISRDASTSQMSNLDNTIPVVPGNNDVIIFDISKLPIITT